MRNFYNDTFNDNVTLYTLLNDRRPNNKGLFPIVYRITYKRQKIYYKSGKYCCLTDWELLTGVSKKAFIIELRNEIQNGHDVIKKNINIIINNNNGVFSFEKFNNIAKKNLVDTLNIAFKSKIQNLNNNDQVGSASYYRCSLNSFTKYKGDNIKFSDITVEWLNKYQKFMIDKNASYTTVGMYCRALRAILNEAKTAGIINDNNYPFGKGKFEIPTGESRKMALTILQVGNLMKAEVNETEKKYRDLWYFSYLCNGINICDLCKLKHSDIKNEIVTWYRQKSIRTSKKKVKIEAVIQPIMIEIIENWKTKNSNPEYLFPFLSGNETPLQAMKIVQNTTKAINKYVKLIALRIGINNISTYTARHSYATVLKRKGAIIASISEGLGHSDIKTTLAYLDSFEKDEQMKNAKLLIP